ncbi:MAG: ZIP family metal transporter [Candidatus Zixiibacteriota bacterium]
MLKIIVLLTVSALANVAGGVMYFLREHWEQESLRLLIGAGAGFMLAVAIGEILPEATARSPQATLWVLGGFLLVHVFEHILTPHFHYGHERHEGLSPHVGTAATGGLMMHSITDGVAIVAAMEVNPQLGFLVLAAVIWHKIPAGFTAASVVGATGGSRRHALGASAIVGLGSILGGLLYLVLPAEKWLGPALGVSVGSLLYVSATDLLPEINRRRSTWAPLGIIIGVLAFYLTHLIFHTH